MDQKHGERHFAHPDQVRVAEASFRVRAVEAPEQDQGPADRTPVSREFGFGFEDCLAEAVEVGAPGDPVGVLLGETGDDAAKEENQWRDDAGNGAAGEEGGGVCRGGHVGEEFGDENPGADVHADEG